MNRHTLLLLSCLLTSACTVSFNTGNTDALPPAVAGTEQQNQEAFEAAKDILHTIDRGEYEKLWEQSGELLKKMATEQDMMNVLKSVRSHLGAPTKRQAPQIGFTSKVDLKGPEGEYCVVIVATDFSGAHVNEKVVMQKETGKWKLVGYFLSSSTDSDAKS